MINSRNKLISGRIAFVAVPMIAVLAGVLAFAMAQAAQTGKASSACDSPEHHQLDFWIGDWDVYDVGHADKITAGIRVERILAGCVLHEIYQDPTGMAGESFSIYDASRGVWHQSWVTNKGKLLVIEGTFNGRQMVLSGTEQKSGRRTTVRGTWQAVDGGVRETAVESVDGEHWTNWFDIMMRRHPQ